MTTRPRLCLQSHSHALPRQYYDRRIVFVPQEGVGVALRVQVGHVVTYRASPEGSLIYTVFTKKFQKRSKRGVPLFLTGKSNAPAN